VDSYRAAADRPEDEPVIERLRRSRLSQLRRSGTIQSGPAKGCRFSAPAGSAQTYLTGSYEPPLAAALARLVQPGSVCADLGAHIGYFTVLLGHLTGSEGRVHAFEPIAENAASIRRNVKLNRMKDRVTVHQAALASSVGRLPIFSARTGGSSEWTLSSEFAEREDVESDVEHPQRSIETTTLEDALGADRVDLMKMDIEGAESEVLPAMFDLLMEQRPLLVLEFHREVGWPGVEALIQANYSFTELDNTPCPTPTGPAAVPYQLIAWPQ